MYKKIEFDIQKLLFVGDYFTFLTLISELK